MCWVDISTTKMASRDIRLNLTILLVLKNGYRKNANGPNSSLAC